MYQIAAVHILKASHAAVPSEFGVHVTDFPNVWFLGNFESSDCQIEVIS